jgi:polysaccharide biosynthesis/export protein
MRTTAAAVVLVLLLTLSPLVGPGLRAQERDPTQRDLGAYRLRVEDTLEIVISNPGSLTPEQTRTVIVPGNGEITLPPLGKLNLLGSTVTEVEEVIAQRLKDGGFHQNPNVGCVVTGYAPRTVSLMGAVQGTLQLPVHRNIRILELLAKAGALSNVGADFSTVLIRRVAADGVPFKIPVNVDAILDQNREEANVVVFEGDIVIVPRLEGTNPLAADWVYVLGKVRSPGRHPVIKGRTPFTLTKLIAMVGDFQEFADRSKVKIIRQTETGRRPYVVDFDDIIKGDRPDFELRADDLVYVPESWF